MSFLGSPHYFAPEEHMASQGASSAAAANGIDAGPLSQGAAADFHRNMLMQERMAREYQMA